MQIVNSLNADIAAKLFLEKKIKYIFLNITFFYKSVKSNKIMILLERRDLTHNSLSDGSVTTP